MRPTATSRGLAFRVSVVWACPKKPGIISFPRLHYQSGNRTYLEDFQKLKVRLDDLDLSEGEDSNRLY